MVVLTCLTLSTIDYKKSLDLLRHFGGISLLVVGDMFQLRSVQDSLIFKESGKGYGPIACNVWHDMMNFFELKTNMRQKDDAPYAELLNRVREGKQT